MKISEVITRLQEIQKEHGDLPFYKQCDWQVEVDDIEVTDDPSNQYDDVDTPKRVLV